jgi:hypothetical protein
MEKVKLPREVAEAIERIKNLVPFQLQDAFILFEACRYDVKDSSPWSVLNQFVRESENIFKLAEALKYGYEIEPQPITVTITPEMQEKARKYFADKEAERKEAEKDGPTLTVRQIDNEVYGARYILKVLGITIPGVND